MATPLLTQKSVLLVKVEATSGTDAVPTPLANALLVSNPQYTVQSDEIERNYTRADLSNYASKLTKRRAQLTFSVEVSGSGNATTPTAPTWAALVEACGFGKSGVIYTPVSTGFKTATIYLYLDGILHKMTGCTGSFKLNAEAGTIATLEFTMQGTYSPPTAVAMPTSAGAGAEALTYENANLSPPLVEFAGLTWNASSSDLVTAALTIDFQNQISQRLDVNSGEGLLAYFIASRNPTATFNPETVIAMATGANGFYDDWSNSDLKALEFVIGATGPAPGGTPVAGNGVKFTAPKAQVTSINYGDRENIRVYDINLALRRNAGNDELAIQFY